jgi:hypothetical protein
MAIHYGSHLIRDGTHFLLDRISRRRRRDAFFKFGILTKEDYLPTPFVAGFIEALRTVAKQLQQDVIADAS